jgi:hypothetical protein
MQKEWVILQTYLAFVLLNSPCICGNSLATNTSSTLLQRLKNLQITPQGFVHLIIPLNSSSMTICCQNFQAL